MPLSTPSTSVAANNCLPPGEAKTSKSILKSPVGDFQWMENWIQIPGSPGKAFGGRTHGVAVLKSGEIVIFHQGDPAVLFYSQNGELLRKWGIFPGAHGLTVVQEDGVEFLWLVDELTKEVVKTTLAGEAVLRIPKPPHLAYETRDFVPTWVAVAEERFGGNGEIWLADGYGCSLVHRFDSKGGYLLTMDGSESGRPFLCPHGVSLDTRHAKTRMAIADRGNRQIRLYDLDGTHARTFGADLFHSPNMTVPFGDLLLVPELVAGLTILDKSDRPLTRLGFHANANQLEGWPDNRRWIQTGLFNSPHSAAVDTQGNIYIVEWITGGRVTKLQRL